MRRNASPKNARRRIRRGARATWIRSPRWMRNSAPKCSPLRIRLMTAPPELRELDEQIATARHQKESAIDDQDFERAARLRDEEKRLTQERQEKDKAWRTGDMDTVAQVDEELIAEVLAASTGIPVFKLTEEESSRLLRMEDELHKRVVGQHDAIVAISQAIRRTRAGLKDPRRPGDRKSTRLN